MEKEVMLVCGAEVINEPRAQLDDNTRFLAIPATLLGWRGIDEFRAMLPATNEISFSLDGQSNT